MHGPCSPAEYPAYRKHCVEIKIGVDLSPSDIIQVHWLTWHLRLTQRDHRLPTPGRGQLTNSVQINASTHHQEMLHVIQPLLDLIRLQS